MQHSEPPPNAVSSATPASATRALLALHIGIVLVAALYFGREVFIPIALAVLLCFALAPLVDRLRSWGLWRVPAVLVSVVAAILVLVALGGIIGTQLAQLAGHLPEYSKTIETKISGAQRYVGDTISWAASRLGLEAPKNEASPAVPHSSTAAAPQPSREAANTSLLTLAEPRVPVRRSRRDSHWSLKRWMPSAPLAIR